MNIAENRIPELRYNGEGDFWEWQSKSRAKLRELLGLDLLEKCDFDFLQEEVTETDEYTQIRFSFQSEPEYYVPAYIRITKNYEGKLSPMICLQGHSNGMHISLGIPKYPGDENSINNGDRDFAKSALENGYCPVIMEQRFMGALAGLIAPRKLVTVSGQLDHGFLIEGAEECMDIAKKLYTYAGCPENVTHVVGELGHRFYAEKGYKAFNKMVK